jgi:hypothetical protein
MCIFKNKTMLYLKQGKTPQYYGNGGTFMVIHF